MHDNLFYLKKKIDVLSFWEVVFSNTLQKKLDSVVEMLSQGLKQWLNTWWEGMASLRELRCMQCTWVSGRGEAGIYPIPDLV